MKQLLFCPFRGIIPELIYKENIWLIECKKCKTTFFQSENKNEVIEKWNSRFNDNSRLSSLYDSLNQIYL